MDGGRTSLMTFMGERITRVAKYEGSTNPRTTTEIVGIGRSASIDSKNQ